MTPTWIGKNTSLLKLSFALLFFQISSLALGQNLFTHCQHLLIRASTQAYWTNTGPYVGVVDPASSGRYLAERLTKRGYRVVAIHTNANIIKALRNTYQAASVHRDLYISKKFNGGLTTEALYAMADKLAQYIHPNVSEEDSLKAIFIGSEDGTILGDALTDFFELNGNNPALSITKRDKGSMHQRLKEAGLNYMASIRVGPDEFERVCEWIYGSENQGRYPVVVKPPDSAATQGVSICYDEKQVKDAIDAAFTKKTVFERDTKEVLIAEYLQEGMADPEFVIDTVSSYGKHIISDSIQYKKIKRQRAKGGSSPIYLDNKTLPLDHEIVRKVREYAFKILDATGVRFGPAHMEFMWTPRGPVLIELGARPAGGGLTEVAGMSYQYHPIDLIIDAYLNPEAFEKIWLQESKELGSAQKHLKPSRQVSLVADNAGYLTALPFFKQMLNLPSYKTHTLSAKIGKWLPRTEDLIDCPGHIELSHEDPEVLERDYNQIRQWEKQSFFTVSKRPWYRWLF